VEDKAMTKTIIARLRDVLYDLEIALIGNMYSDIYFCIVVEKDPRPALKKIMAVHQLIVREALENATNSSEALNENKGIKEIGRLLSIIEAEINAQNQLDGLVDPMKLLMKLLPEAQEVLHHMILEE
jgi:hypothetical protein